MVRRMGPEAKHELPCAQHWAPLGRGEDADGSGSVRSPNPEAPVSISVLALGQLSYAVQTPAARVLPLQVLASLRQC